MGKKLAAAQAQLLEFQAGQNEKVKKVLMNFMGGNSGAILALFFKEWKNILKVIKMEAEIRAEFDARREIVQKKLFEFKAAQSAGLQKIMNNKGAAYELALVEDAFGIWKKDAKTKSSNGNGRRKPRRSRPSSLR